LRLFHQPHDPRECRPLSRAGHRNPQRAFAVDRTGDHAVTGVFPHRSGLARNHRFVDIAVALAYLAIGGDACAGPHEHEITVHECRQWYFLCALAAASIAYHAHSVARQQLGEFGKRPLRLIDGTHLDPVAEEHDRD
jgi:hypothetical protein